MTVSALRLKEILDYAVKCRQFVNNLYGDNKTYCNLFTKSILNSVAANLWVTRCKKDKVIPADSIFQYADYFYDISSMRPGAPLEEVMHRTDTRTEYANISRMAKSGIYTADTHDEILPQQAGKYPIQIDASMAQDYANEGVPILVISAICPPVGHEAIVYPTGEPYDEWKGCMIAQAGPPFIGWISSPYSFGDYWKQSGNDIKYFKFPKETD